jgi:hypothetical protein
MKQSNVVKKVSKREKGLERKGKSKITKLIKVCRKKG